MRYVAQSLVDFIEDESWAGREAAGKSRSRAVAVHMGYEYRADGANTDWTRAGRKYGVPRVKRDNVYLCYRWLLLVCR